MSVIENMESNAGRVMKRKFLWSLLFPSILLLISSVAQGDEGLENGLKARHWAKPSRDASPSDSPRIRSLVKADGIWTALEQRRESLAANDVQSADKKLDEIHQIALDTGIRNLPEVSGALLLEAHNSLIRGNAVRAKELAVSAGRLSPDLSRPHLLLARIGLKNREPINFFAELSHSLIKFFQYTPELLPFAAQLVTMVIVAVFLTLIAYTVVLLLRYWGLLTHLFCHLLPKGSTHAQAGWAILLTLVALSIFGFGVLTIAIVALMAMWLLLQTNERVVALVLLGMVGVMDPVLGLCDRALLFSGSVEHDIFMAKYAHQSPRLFERLEGQVDSRPNDRQAAMALAVLAKRQGQLQLADRLLKELVANEPRQAAHRVNLAVVLVGQNRLKEARDELELALNLEPNNVVARFNRGKVGVLLQESDARAHIEMATRMDADRLELFQQHETTTLNRFLMDQMPGDWALVRRIVTKPQDRPLIAGVLSSLFLGRLPSSLSSLFILVLILGVTLFSFFRRRAFGVVGFCLKCHLPVCARCSSHSAPTAHCLQCHDVFLRFAKVPPPVRYEVTRRIKLRERRLRWGSMALTFLTAGGGHVLQGNAIWGGILMWLFAFLGIGVMVYPGLLRTSLIPDPFPSVKMAFLIGALIVIGLLGLVSGGIRRMKQENI